MSETEVKWQVNSHLILYRPADSAVWLLATDSGWVLPEVSPADRVWVRPGTELNRQVQAQWGIRAITLNCARLRVNRDQCYEESVYVLEVREERPNTLENGRFFTCSNLTGLTFAQPEEQRSILEDYLNEVENGVPQYRPPWLRPGWFDEASAWMTAELTRLGYSITGEVEQVNNWPLSCVLRSRTKAGDVYLKAVVDMPLFVNEPVVLGKLARLCPGNVPMPLAIEPTKRWMLLPDFGAAVGRNSRMETQAEMVRQFGQIQAHLAAHVPELLQIGCLDRRLDRLAAQLDALLADQATIARLETAELDRLRQSVPRLKEICAELATYRVPQTLVHGDLHLDNVAWQNDRMLFFDWTDACISHPFLDMMVIYEEPDEASRTYLRDEYLKAWTNFEPMERLLEVWQLAGALWPLHQSVSYQYILANLEEAAQKGFEGVVPYYLREVLKVVAHM